MRNNATKKKKKTDTTFSNGNQGRIFTYLERMESRTKNSLGSLFQSSWSWGLRRFYSNASLLQSHRKESKQEEMKGIAGLPQHSKLSSNERVGSPILRQGLFRMVGYIGNLFLMVLIFFFPYSSSIVIFLWYQNKNNLFESLKFDLWFPSEWQQACFYVRFKKFILNNYRISVTTTEIWRKLGTFFKHIYLYTVCVRCPQVYVDKIIKKMKELANV